MATSAVTTSAATWIVAPTLENHFGIDLDIEHDPVNTSEVVWQNPYLNSAITPYVPPEDDKALLASCQEAFQKLNVFVDVTAEALLTTNDVSVIIFSQLDPKSLSRCSKVCKSFYLTTKNQILWDNLFASCFKNVKPLGSEICIFTPQQQFQTIYKKINDHKKPYFAKFDHLQEKCLGFYKQLTPLIFQFNEFGGKDVADDTMKKMDAARLQVWVNIANVDVEENSKVLSQLYGSDGYKAHLLKKKIDYLNNCIKWNVGGNYNGTIESIDGNSNLGRILTAIEQFIPRAFDNQEKFEEVIRQSEASKATTSLNDGPVIEDVTDLDQTIN